MKIILLRFFLILILFHATAKAKPGLLLQLDFSNGLRVTDFKLTNGQIHKPGDIIPLFSFNLNDVYQTSLNLKASEVQDADTLRLFFKDQLKIEIFDVSKKSFPWQAQIKFQNLSSDTIKIADIIPFGQADDRIFITATGPLSLTRAKLFRPGQGPIGVILPDNAWEMGYADVPIASDISLCALSRRKEVTAGIRRRYWTLLAPLGQVKYTIYAETYQGDWQNGLRLMFRDRYLYDLDQFDNTLYEREDLAWIRKCYLITLQMAWDHEFFDLLRGGYQIEKYLEMGRQFFGRWDAYVLWPTWPALGLDQRNQWDLYGDLPGGLKKLREIVRKTQQEGTRFFISYNPWDQSTRSIDPYQGMAQLLKETESDGVVLDTYGWSNKKLQDTADSIRSGIVMYSEGMAVPKDLPGIITGRVHDAIRLTPPLNLNKLIKADNAIFRVGQPFDGNLHREAAVAFFNGYGMEINMFRPGRPDWLEEEFSYIARLIQILRQNNRAFLSQEWTPLLNTLKDSIWVNEWPAEDKTIYTILSFRPEGVDQPLFPVNPAPAKHYVSLYHHEELRPDTLGEKIYLPVKTEAFHRSWLNTRKEGNVDCIAVLPQYLQVKLSLDSLKFGSKKGDQIIIWQGMPGYRSPSVTFDIQEKSLKLSDLFDRYEGKIVLQLMQKDELLDERIVILEMQMPHLISRISRTAYVSGAVPGMVKIEGCENYLFRNQGESDFIPYNDHPQGEFVQVRSFYMDKYPVTNAEFKKFLEETGYQPADRTNFLKHWPAGNYLPELRDYPVVYVSLEDAQSYARWAGKRLPSELEWQYAAQGSDGRRWPWGMEFDSSRCNVGLDSLTPVDRFVHGTSPFGVLDMVGNIWQLTNDVYDNGSYYFIIIRGGSYFNPTSSWWYVKGGPQPLDRTQMLLRVSPGFERNATVGFRCVRDAK